MINTRSTYYRTVEFGNPPCDEYTMNLYIWTGLQSAVPVSPTYSITRTNYESSIASENGRQIQTFEIERRFVGPNVVSSDAAAIPVQRSGAAVEILGGRVCG